MPLYLQFWFVVQDIFVYLEAFLTCPLKFLKQDISLTLCSINGWKALDMRIYYIVTWILVGNFCKSQHFGGSARLKRRLYLKVHSIVNALALSPFDLEGVNNQVTFSWFILSCYSQFVHHIFQAHIWNLQPALISLIIGCKEEFWNHCRRFKKKSEIWSIFLLWHGGMENWVKLLWILVTQIFLASWKHLSTCHTTPLTPSMYE